MFEASPLIVTTRTLVAASHPKFFAPDSSAIELVAEFAELKSLGPIPFVADRDDGAMHGRAIYERALAGEFGEVAAYVPPAPAE